MPTALLGAVCSLLYWELYAYCSIGRSMLTTLSGAPTALSGALCPLLYRELHAHCSIGSSMPTFILGDLCSWLTALSGALFLTGCSWLNRWQNSFSVDFPQTEFTCLIPCLLASNQVHLPQPTSTESLLMQNSELVQNAVFRFGPKMQNSISALYENFRSRPKC